MLFLRPFLCHRSANTCQIDLYKVSNSKLKPEVCNCVKTEVIESRAPSQQKHKRGTVLLGQPVELRINLSKFTDMGPIPSPIYVGILMGKT